MKGMREEIDTLNNKLVEKDLHIQALEKRMPAASGNAGLLQFAAAVHKN